jgi:hypothetical protein
VHLRRALLLFTLVLGLTALAAAISPSRDGGDAVAPPAAVARPSRPPFRDVVFEMRPSGKATERRADVGEHLVVSVSSPEGGVATVPKLGLTASVALDAPARFDLLAPSPGRYDVFFAESALDEPQRVGTLVTAP